MRKQKQATKKTTPFAGPNQLRTFAHPDGRTYELQVIDCRVYESWVNAGHGGGSNVSTRDDDDDAATFAWKKARALIKKGFVEGLGKTGRIVDRGANVVDVLRSDLDYQGRPIDDFQPLPGRAHTFHAKHVSVETWLVTNDEATCAIHTRCSVYKSALASEMRAAIASGVLDLLTTQRHAIFADETTPVRTFALGPDAAPFTQVVVLSPTVENYLVKGRFTVSRSVFRAFPAFECEFCEDDSVTVAEARCRSNLPYTKWDRAPHPVVDLAYLKETNDPPKFLVYPPTEVEERLISGLATLPATEVQARNHRGEVRRFLRGQRPPELRELRAFFGFAP